MLDGWIELPAWLRVGLGVVMVVTGSLVLWAWTTEYFAMPRRHVLTLGLALAGLGFGIILVNIKSDN
ncbi:MAG TPA: hypothetical protein PJ982_20310, partial [Lacipirellulaceae bacterium]|nr:hypothetical protein [Lacipirellulaceae bacterium]